MQDILLAEKHPRKTETGLEYCFWLGMLKFGLISPKLLQFLLDSLSGFHDDNMEGHEDSIFLHSTKSEAFHLGFLQ